MIQGRGGARFLKKTAAIFLRDRFRRQHFERDHAMKFFIVCLIDRTHSTHTECFQDAVVRDSCGLRRRFHERINRREFNLIWARVRSNSRSILHNLT